MLEFIKRAWRGEANYWQTFVMFGVIGNLPFLVEIISKFLFPRCLYSAMSKQNVWGNGYWCQQPIVGDLLRILSEDRFEMVAIFVWPFFSIPLSIFLMIRNSKNSVHPGASVAFNALYCLLLTLALLAIVVVKLIFINSFNAI